VVAIPAITVPNTGNGEAKDMDAESIMNVETRMVPDWTWKDKRKGFQDLWKRRRRVPDNAKGGSKLALYAGAPSNCPETPRGKKAPPSKNSWKKLKGTCNSCSIQGHKAVDC
jgi:hypothetical protein